MVEDREAGLPSWQQFLMMLVPPFWKGPCRLTPRHCPSDLDLRSQIVFLIVSCSVIPVRHIRFSFSSGVIRVRVFSESSKFHALEFQSVFSQGLPKISYAIIPAKIFSDSFRKYMLYHSSQGFTRAFLKCHVLLFLSANFVSAAILVPTAIIS